MYVCALTGRRPWAFDYTALGLRLKFHPEHWAVDRGDAARSFRPLANNRTQDPVTNTCTGSQFPSKCQSGVEEEAGVMG